MGLRQSLRVAAGALLLACDVGAGTYRYPGGETMTRRPVAALLFALLLSGCQSVDVAPAKPSLQIPAAWRTATGPASATEQVWWRNFHDSHLNRYVEIGRAHV